MGPNGPQAPGRDGGIVFVHPEPGNPNLLGESTEGAARAGGPPPVILAKARLANLTANSADQCGALYPAGSGIERKHWGASIFCPPGYIATGGGGSCQIWPYGGTMLENRPVGHLPSGRATGSSGWYVDCCVYTDGRTRPDASGDNGWGYAVCGLVDPDLARAAGIR